MDMCADDDFAASFERCVMNGFSRAGYLCSEIFRPGSIIVFGVSGGADSMALLLACSRIRDALNPASADAVRFLVITVDHNIRSPEESGGDAAFVSRFCELLPFTECKIISMEKGSVECLAKERGRGIEEAARFLRYQIFEEAAEESGASVFCLAHNRNDQLETLLLRFLQGSSGTAASGIPRSRGIFVRPLLDISRNDIVRYLSEFSVPYRTDMTNFDNRYLRNKYRNELIPVLDNLVPGWDTAVLAGAEKNADDAAFIDSLADGCVWQEYGKALQMQTSVFFNQPEAIKRRLLYRAFDTIKTEKRIPYAFIRQICCACNGDGVFSFSGGGIVVDSDGTLLRVYRNENGNTEFTSGFYIVLTTPGTYTFPFGTVVVRRTGKSAFGDIIGPLSAPVIVRSAELCDTVYTAGGVRKNVSKICAELGIPAEERLSVPVIEAYASQTVIPWTVKTGFIFNAEKFAFEQLPSEKKDSFWIEIFSDI